MKPEKKFKVIGDFLATYYTDLVYIQGFQRHKNDELYAKEFALSPDGKKPGGMFYKFLVEYGVTRNFVKGKSTVILKYTNEWLNENKANYKAVGGLSERLQSKGITTLNRKVTSLASKILFLNNPWEVFPMDSQAKKALSLNESATYEIFWTEVDNYSKNTETIKFMNTELKSIKKYVTDIEKYFIKLPDIETIRKNRFIDKLLWVEGNENNNGSE